MPSSRDDRSTNQRGRRRLWILLIIFLFLCASGWAIYRAVRPPGPLSSWPQVPEEGEVHVEPPPLRIPSAGCFEEEVQRVLLLAEADGDLEFRLSWTPDDDRSRVRTWPFSGRLPGVGPNWFGELWMWLGLSAPPDFDPVLLAAVPPDANASTHLQRLTQLSGHLAPITGRGPPQPMPLRLYLGGRTPDGSIGAIPFRTLQTFRTMMSARGYGPSPPDAAVEVRIIRRDGRVRYRWGHFPSRGNRLPRWTGGDVTLTAAQVSAPGRGPLLPGLAKWLRVRGVAGNLGPHCRAVLELGPHVTWVDVLRTVESGEGDPAVVWYRGSSGFRRSEIAKRLPIMPLPLEEAFGDRLDLQLMPGSLQLEIDAAGVIRKDKRVIRPDRISRYLPRMTDGGNCLRIAADRTAPWSAVRPLVAGARTMELSLGFVFQSPEAPFSFEPCLMFQLADPATANVRISADADHIEPEPMAGRTVLLAPPDGLTVEDVLLLVAELKLRGAAGIAFE